MLSVLMEEMLDYDSFVSTILLIMKNRMGDGYDVRIYKVMKNNSLELHSLVVRKEDKNIAPNIYLKSYYEAYLEGISLEEIADRLCMIYSSSQIPEFHQGFSYTFEEMRPYLFFRLVSYEKNQKLLETVPYFRYLDLAVTFHCLVRDDEEGIGTVRVTNEHMGLWEITLEELKNYAMLNTERLFPATIKSMEEVLLGMLKDTTPNEAEEMRQLLSLEDRSQEAGDEHYRPSMYILSNKKGINGASSLLYKDVIRSFAKRHRTDLFMLPSSIHEIILIPRDKNMKIEGLSKMVEEVNRTQVAEEEVLSDHVYYYSLEKDTIFL